MQDRFKLFRRGAVFYCQDRSTGQQKSLQTRDKAEARRIIQAKNDTITQPLMNLVMARTYLAAQDPKMITRTWADVMEMFCNRGKPATRIRHERVVKTKPMLFLRDKRLIETTADDFFHALSLGTNSTVLFLQTLHNDALGIPREPVRPVEFPFRHRPGQAIRTFHSLRLWAPCNQSIGRPHRRGRPCI
jgi:hypothetical protein